MNAGSDNVIDFEWIKTPSALEYVNSLLHQNEKRQFGLLERPSLPPNKMLTIVKYKVFLCGKSGVGKSTLISQLACGDPGESGSESAGIATTILHWPVRLKSSGQIMFFQLHFWDVAENTLKKFDHILPACKAELDCVMFTFSLTDRASFMEIPALVNQMDDIQKDPVQVIVATKTDQYAYCDISEKEITNLSEGRGIPVLRLKSLMKKNLSAKASLFEMAPFLNNLCSLLFYRDCVMANDLNGNSKNISV